MTTSSSSIDVKTNWSVDVIHSDLSFQIKHLMISLVSGYIKSFDLEVETSRDDFGEVTDLTLTAYMTSLTTNHEPRDEHLKSQDFFDVINYPHLTFKSILLQKQGMKPPSLLSAYRRDFKLQGILQIKGVSVLITLDGEFGGTSIDSSGHKRAGFSLRGKISRKDFGLKWAGTLDSGKFIVADEVNIVANIQLIKQVENTNPLRLFQKG
jgi:polyisoprenoid-binding protein YceI